MTRKKSYFASLCHTTATKTVEISSSQSFENAQKEGPNLQVPASVLN
jgi:hypothetical protein